MEIKTIRKDRLQNMEHFQFAGKTQGTGKKKAYELAYSTDPKRTLWVVREKDELKEVKR